MSTPALLREAGFSELAAVLDEEWGELDTEGRKALMVRVERAIEHYLDSLLVEGAAEQKELR